MFIASGFVLAIVPRTSLAQLSGDHRTGFVDSGTKSCLERAKAGLAGNEKFLEAAGLDVNRLDAYCRCIMSEEADHITPEEFGQLSQGQKPDSLETEAKTARAKCLPLMRASPPGDALHGGG
jgi:hypothetical protein